MTNTRPSYGTLPLQMTARTCDHPVAAGQRYCLVCGEACAPPRVDWRALLQQGTPGTERTGPPAAAPGPRLPSPRTAAALVLGMLGFGVLIGGAAGPAGARGQGQLIIVQLPTPQAAAPTPAEPDTPSDSGDTALDSSTPSAAAAVPEEPASDAAPEAGGQTPPAEPTPTEDTPAAPAPTLPPVKHVWILALRGTPFADPAAAPYLAGELRRQGTLMTAFTAPDADPLVTGAALLSGTKGDKPAYAAKVPTLIDRLTGGGQAWKAYVDTAPLAAGESLCAPGSPLADRNPLLRFASIATSSECGSQVAPIEQLARDVATPDAAPALSYLVPAAEHDGTDAAGTDAWARTTIETIRASKAYADGGLIVVLGGAAAPDATQPPGALLVSPFVKPGATQGAALDVYGLTRTIETFFSLPALDTPLTKDATPLDAQSFGLWKPKQQ